MPDTDCAALVPGMVNNACPRQNARLTNHSGRTLSGWRPKALGRSGGE